MDDRRLTEHFSLFDLTATTHADLQYINRIVTVDQMVKLQRVAELAENIWALGVMLKATSGYRCPALNVAVGSTERSQHLKCEAMDGIPLGQPVVDAFKTLRALAKDRKFSFGQLILEKDDREGHKEWIHLSLGFPYRSPERSGQILTMNQGSYNLIETINQEGIS